jgi:hypothetical protein
MVYGKNEITEKNMKKKFAYIVSILIILSLVACGSAEPTMSPEDASNTAIANAWVAVTQTQAALPTATPVPPTFTPEPTATLFPTLPPPTLAPATVAVPTTAACDQIPSLEPKGTLVNVEFQNKAQGQANLAFGMISPNDKGECVTYSFGIGWGDVVPTKVLAGCYWGYAWITGDDTSVAKSGDLVLCVTDPGRVYHIVITKEQVNFK